MKDIYIGYDQAKGEDKTVYIDLTLKDNDFFFKRATEREVKIRILEEDIKTEKNPLKRFEMQIELDVLQSNVWESKPLIGAKK